jgi:hypothetical protein
MKNAIRLALVLLCILSFTAVLYYLLGHLAYRSRTVAESRLKVVELTKEAARKINAVLQQAVIAADSAAGFFTSGKFGLPGAKQFLRKLLKQNPYFYSGTITYKPYGYDPNRRLYSCFYVKNGQKLCYIQLDRHYDYTNPGYEWYGKAIEKGTHWSEPYFDRAASVLMVTYSSVFYRAGPGTKRKIPLGVITIDISLEGLTQIIESIDLGPGGYGSILSKKGVYLYHPNRELVIARMSILDVAREWNDPDRILLSERMSRGESGIIDHISTSTNGLESWLTYQPIPITGWSLQNTFLKNDIPLHRNTLRKQLIRITLVGLIFMIFLLLMIVSFIPAAPWRSWVISIGITILLLVSIACVWHFAMNFQSLEHQKNEYKKIISPPALEAFKHKIARGHAKLKQAPLYIPTGILVESLKFSDTNVLSITGSIWQTYSVETHKGLAREVFIPETESFQAQKIFHIRKGDNEFIRWRFRAKLYTQLQCSRYPLELEKIGIPLRHNSMNENVLLVPDLEAYRIRNPASLPGLKKEIVLPGWTLKRSFFEYRKESFGTNFGFKQPNATGSYHNLYYNFVISKNFLDSFISNLTPLILVALLLFAILFISRSDLKMAKNLDTAAGKVLGFCSGLFFVVVFSHIGIRQKISAEEVFYLEYFYFIMYLALFWVSMNSLLLSLAKNLKIIQYKDGLISKLMYWPLLLGLLTGITCITFY